MKHTAIYLRVSTDKQTTRSQRADLDSWAANESGPVKIYSDTFTGKTMDRPGWRRLERQVELGNVSKVVCWRLDRLGRTASGLTKLFDDLRERDVSRASLRDGLDLSTPAGRLMANVLASISQFEREVIAERIHAGQAAARKAGKRWGGRKPGTRVTVTLEQIATIKRMSSEGDSKTAMARATGLSRPTVYTVLKEASAEQHLSNNGCKNLEP